MPALQADFCSQSSPSTSFFTPKQRNSNSAFGPVSNGNGETSNGVHTDPFTKCSQASLNTSANVNGITNGHSLSVSETGIAKAQLTLYDSQRLCLTWNGRTTVGCGLVNLGNTCFLNSVLQCLTYTPAFANHLTTNEHSNACRANGYCALCALQALICRCLGTAAGSAVKPLKILQNLKAIAKSLSWGRQEDAHEFLRYLVDAMQNNALSSHPGADKLDKWSKETTVIYQIFGGYLRSQVKCRSCHFTSNTYEALLDLSLDIKGVDSVEGALQKFVRPENLNLDNAYKCDRCKSKVEAEKKYTVEKAPAVLTIHLKRFDMSSFINSKISRHINFPVQLNLRPYTSDKQSAPINYSLYGVLVHSGFSCSSGHYYSYIKSPSGDWYCMNDSSVTRTLLSDVSRAEAYILFYSKIQRAAQPRSASHSAGGGAPSTCNAMIGPRMPPRMVNGSSKVALVPYDSNGNNSDEENKAEDRNTKSKLVSSSDEISISKRQFAVTYDKRKRPLAYQSNSTDQTTKSTLFTPRTILKTVTHNSKPALESKSESSDRNSNGINRNNNSKNEHTLYNSQQAEAASHSRLNGSCETEKPRESHVSLKHLQEGEQSPASDRLKTIIPNSPDHFKQSPNKKRISLEQYRSSHSRGDSPRRSRSRSPQSKHRSKSRSSQRHRSRSRSSHRSNWQRTSFSRRNSPGSRKDSSPGRRSSPRSRRSSPRSRRSSPRSRRSSPRSRRSSPRSRRSSPRSRRSSPRSRRSSPCSRKSSLSHSDWRSPPRRYRSRSPTDRSLYRRERDHSYHQSDRYQGNHCFNGREAHRYHDNHRDRSHERRHSKRRSRSKDRGWNKSASPRCHRKRSRNARSPSPFHDRKLHSKSPSKERQCSRERNNDLVQKTRQSSYEEAVYREDSGKSGGRSSADFLAKLQTKKSKKDNLKSMTTWYDQENSTPPRFEDDDKTVAHKLNALQKLKNFARH